MNFNSFINLLIWGFGILVAFIVFHRLYDEILRMKQKRHVDKLLSMPEEERNKLMKNGGDRELKTEKEVLEYVREQQNRSFILARARELERRERGTTPTTQLQGHGNVPSSNSATVPNLNQRATGGTKKVSLTKPADFRDEQANGN